MPNGIDPNAIKARRAVTDTEGQWQQKEYESGIIESVLVAPSAAYKLLKGV